MLGGVFMLLTVIILLCFGILMSFLCYCLVKVNPVCIYDLSVNGLIPEKMKLLRKTIDIYLQDDLILIVLHDDIKFLDKKFYWPRRTAYIHFSDLAQFLQKYTRIS